MEKLVFQDENGEDTEFYVLEQTRVSGVNYLLVADSQEEDAQCLILRDTAGEEEPDSLYEVVEEEAEQDALLAVFEQLLGDTKIDK